MRILMISGEFPPMQGGVGDYTREIARAFAVQGHRVWVLVPHALQDAYPQREAQPWHVLPAIRNWKWGCWRPILSALHETQPDVVHVQYQAATYDMRIPAINLLPWRLRCQADSPPVVVTFHDLKPPYLFPKAGPLRKWTLRLLARHSAAVILTNAEDLSAASAWPFARQPAELVSDGRSASTPSNQRRMPHARTTQPPTDALRRHHPTLHQIPIGSNIAVAPPASFDRSVWRTRLGYRPGDFVWAYFGFLNESKGGETLIRALARSIPGTHLLMIGGRVGSSDRTNQAYAARMEALMGELGVTERVRWTGYVPAKEVSAALLSADILVLPYRDGVSFRRGSLHAALVHGCAIVSTVPRVPLPDFRDGENILLVPPGEPEALTQAALCLQCDPALRLRIGVGAEALAQQFTWQQIARRTVEEVFQPLVAARQARRRARR